MPVSDLEEGERNCPEHRVVTPNNNSQRLKFDIRSTEWQDFVFDARNLLETIFQNLQKQTPDATFIVVAN